MLRRDLGMISVGVVIAAALFGVYRWQSPSDNQAARDVAALSALSAPATPATGTAQDALAATAAPAAGKTPRVPSVADSLGKLAARLEKSGGSAADWQLLGKSYEFLGRKDEANAAFARAGGAAATTTGPTTAPAVRVVGTVDVAPGLRAKIPANASLFILARSALLRGPPLAVIKVPAQGWPVKFQLDDSNAMMPAFNLSSAEKVIVEARISASGNPLAQPGDLSGILRNVDPRGALALRIRIDHAVSATP